MADTVPLIDLDAAPRAATVAPARLRFGVPRPVLALGVLIAALLTLGAAVPPAPLMRPVLSAGGTAAAAFTLGPGMLYTASFGQNPNSESGIRGYALPDGRQLWATSLPQNVQDLSLDGGVLLARSGSSPQMSFLDATDGKVLWRLDKPAALVVTLADEQALLRFDREDGSTELRLVAARTGATIWSRVLAGVAELLGDDLYGDDPDRVVVLGVRGHVTTLRFADGSVLGEGELGVRAPTDSDWTVPDDFVGIAVAGDQLYVSRRDQGRVALTAYGLPGLTRRWRAEGGPAGFVHDCGPVLCISDTHRVSGLDPGDGSVRWSAAAWSNAFKLGDDSLLAYDQQEAPESAVLDARTGAVRRRLGATVLIGALELRADHRILGRTWVSAADPGGGPVHVVGSFETGAPFGCTAYPPYLACPTTAGPTTVWQIPAA